MKKFTKILFAILLSVCAVFALVACVDQNAETPKEETPSDEPAHIHTFADEWSIDEQYHWYASTCEHSETNGKAEHTFDDNDICSVCKHDGSYGLEFEGLTNGRDYIVYYAVNGIKNGSGVKDVVIPSRYRGCSVIRINEEAFLECEDLTSVFFPASIEDIFARAFKDCINLKSVTFEKNIKLRSVYPSIFEGCSNLTSIDVPDSVDYISEKAFSGCSSLEKITFGKNSKCRYIDSEAFENCVALQGIEIPKSMNSINSFAFAGCSNLGSIKVDEKNEKLKSEGNCVIRMEDNDNVLIVGCKNSVIPNYVTTIADHAFYRCVGLTNINIPKSVTSINSNAFEGCVGLTSIVIPDSITWMGIYVFYNCSNLTNIYCELERMPDRDWAYYWNWRDYAFINVDWGYNG